MSKPFRKTDRDFAEEIFRNVEQQRTSGNGILGSELIEEVLLDKNTGEIIPIKITHTALTIDPQGQPLSITRVGSVLLDCGHRPCSLDQVLGRCKNQHIICTKDKLYACVICGEKLCDRDVLWYDEDSPVCEEHDDDIRKIENKENVLRIAGNTLLYLCGWSGEGEDEQ